MCRDNLELMFPRDKPPNLEILRLGHKSQAEMLARGETREKIALDLGTTPERIGNLTKTPAFSNLIASYKKG